MIQLRDYQRDFAARIGAAWSSSRVVCGVLPTGGGKTVVFSSIMHAHNGAAAAVVHRKEIVGQISQALGRLGVSHRVIAPPAVVTRIRRRHLREFGRSYVDPHARAGVVSVQTLTSKADHGLGAWLAQITLAVFDEGHHYVRRGLWGRAVEMMSAARILLVTATPERADGLGLGADADGYAETLVEGPSVQWLIGEGYLSPFRYLAPSTDLDVSRLAVTASGDFNPQALRARVVESHLVGDTVEHYRRFASGKRAIIFATDVATAGEMAAAFVAAGISAAALSGESDPADRDARLDEFEAGGLSVLVNVGLFDEGFDVPAVDVVMLARPTESLGRYLQMVGRVLRVVYADGYDLDTAEGRRAAIAAGPKPHALVIDSVRNWERHGMPNWPRVWSLSGREKRSAGPRDTIPQRVCPSCTQPYERIYPACPYCGEPPPLPASRSTPDQVDGDLAELDVDGMAQLFAAIRRADMPDDEYNLDQARRHIPQIGRAADMRRHREAKYRRAVLRELVGWWVGAQDGRTMPEIHRRFFHRFGVDIGTAFTLSAAETDALIGRIQQRFGEDLTC